MVRVGHLLIFTVYELSIESANNSRYIGESRYVNGRRELQMDGAKTIVSVLNL
jgi:hypothetical protein